MSTTLSATSCSAWRLYVIIDADAAAGRDLTRIAEQAIGGGADVIQLRDKRASARALIEAGLRLRQVARAHGVPLIVNDRADVALAIGADGVHLGQDDLPVSAARQMLGTGRIIGCSTHSLSQALDAVREPVDYIAVGPVFATPTKPDYGCVGVELVRQVVARVTIPLVAIGGIDATTLPAVLDAGARCVAVVRAVCGAADPRAAARTLKTTLETVHTP